MTRLPGSREGAGLSWTPALSIPLEMTTPASDRIGPSSAPSPDGPPLDLGTLRRLREDVGGRPGLDRLIGVFLGELAGRRAAVRRSAADRDLPALRLAAHTLKSSAALLGAGRLADVCRSLESMAVEGASGDRVAAALEGFDDECRRVGEALVALRLEPDQLSSEPENR